MIKTYCDLCGTEIETADSQVNLDWHAFGVSGFVGDDYNFHAECAVRVKKAMDEFIRTPRVVTGGPRFDMEGVKSTLIDQAIEAPTDVLAW